MSGSEIRSFSYPGPLPLMPKCGVAIRFIAVLLDLLISIFLVLPLAPYVTHGAFAMLFLLLEFGYRRVFGATPGQQIVGIRSQSGSTFRTTSASRQWLRAVAGIVAVLYLGLTLCAGFLISSLTDEKLNRQRVTAIPVDTSRPPLRAGGEWQVFPYLAVLTPERSAWPAELSRCCIFYGGESSDERVNPGSFIYVTGDLHPYDYCGGQQSQTLRFLSGCRKTPLEYQRWISEIAPGDRWKIWNPAAVVRTNFALLAKSMYFDELDAGTPIRRFPIEGGEVLWFQGHRTLTRKQEKVRVALDRFLIASPKQFASVDIVWKKVPRDAAMVERVAASLRFTPPHDLQQQNRLLSRMNAWRTHRDDVTIADALRAELAASGTDRERRWFAATIASEARRDPKLTPVAERTNRWNQAIQP